MLTVNSVISGAFGLTVSGSGTTVLSGTNTFSKGLTVSGGATVEFTAEANLGGTGDAVTLNNGTINQTSTTAGVISTHIYSIGAGGGTFNFAGTAAGGGTASKIQFKTANQLTGSGTLTLTGGGCLTITMGQSFTGAWIINGGVLEANNATASGPTRPAIRSRSKTAAS